MGAKVMDVDATSLLLQLAPLPWLHSPQTSILEAQQLQLKAWGGVSVAAWWQVTGESLAHTHQRWTNNGFPKQSR